MGATRRTLALGPLANVHDSAILCILREPFEIRHLIGDVLRQPGPLVARGSLHAVQHPQQVRAAVAESRVGAVFGARGNEIAPRLFEVEIHIRLLHEHEVILDPLWAVIEAG